MDDTASSVDQPWALTTAQHGLLTRVVAALPPAAHSFSDLADEYHSILSQHPETDHAGCYALLLRLGFEDGADWREKWARVQARLADQGVVPAPAQPPAPTRLEQHLSTLARTRPRPFLVDPHTTATSDDESDARAPPAAPAPRRFARAPSPQLTEGEFVAIQFRRRALLANAISRWAAVSTGHRQRVSAVDAARRTHLLRLSLQRWHARTAHLAVLERRCDALLDTRDVHLVARTMGTWKKRVERRRRAEWEAGLKHGWDVVTGKWNSQALRGTFEHWHRATQDRQAASHDRQRVLLRSVALWRSRAGHQRSLTRLADDKVAAKDRGVLTSVMSVWEKRSKLAIGERWWKSRGEMQLCADTWHKWSTKLHSNALADDFRDRISLKAALSAWTRRLAHVDELDALSTSFRAATSTALAARSFAKWRKQELCENLLRGHEQKLAERYLRRWIERFAVVTIDLDGQASALVSHTNTVLLATTFSKWMDSHARQNELATRADSVSAMRLQRRALSGWRTSLEQNRLGTEKAEAVREFFLKRQAWNGWVKLLAMRRQARWTAKGERNRLQEFFTLWHEATMQARQDQLQVVLFRAQSEQRLMASLLLKWTTRVAELKERELSVEAESDNKLLAHAFKKWTDRCIQHAEDLSLVESFRDVKEEELRLRVFRHWFQTTRHRRLLRERLEGFELQKEGVMLEIVWETWRDRFGESILVEKEQSVLQMRGERLLRETYSRWKSSSLTLPAIQFDAAKTKRRAFNLWIRQVPKQALVNLAIERDVRATTGHVFLVWHLKAKSRSTIRAASRFRALNTSTSPPALAISPPHFTRHPPVTPSLRPAAGPPMLTPTPQRRPTSSSRSPAAQLEEDLFARPLSAHRFGTPISAVTPARYAIPLPSISPHNRPRVRGSSVSDISRETEERPSSRGEGHVVGGLRETMRARLAAAAAASAKRGTTRD